MTSASCALFALLLLSMTGCASRHQAAAAADGTTTTVAADTAPGTATSADTSTEDKAGAGHLSLTGEYTLETDFIVENCNVAPAGDGLLSGYHMAAKSGGDIPLLSVALKDYSKDGPYEQAASSPEKAVGQAMTTGVMGPLTMMIMKEGGTMPLAFGQVAGSKLTITVSNEGAKGVAEFTDLQSQPNMAEFDPKSGAMPKGKRVSGSVTWACGSVGRINAKMNDAVNGMFKKLIPPR
jgi:hypothetical protein